MLLIPDVHASVDLSESNFNRLKYVFSEERISTMSEEEIEKYLSYDLENSSATQKIFKVTENTNGYTYSEVSEEEANAALNNNAIVPYDATYRETSYKVVRITSSLIGGNKYLMNQYTRWLISPAVKSFDVAAMRLDDVSIVDGTQYGTQVYKIGSNYETVIYHPDGTNIKKASNGFGISMNLVDNSTYFECDIEADVIATTKYATVYGTYQHAVRNMTLAQSQNYTISHNGLGGVVNFASGVVQYYDRMGGVEIALNYTA